MRVKSAGSKVLVCAMVSFTSAIASNSPSLAESATLAVTTQDQPERIGPFAALFQRWNQPVPQPPLAMPLAEGRLSSGFGMRLNPVLGVWMLHEGVDWSAPWGTPIYAAGSGVVESAGWESGYGYTTRILHANGVETTYAHQSSIADGIVAGAEVVQGQVIGAVGATGQATGPHLHYEVRVNGDLVDPLGVELQQAGLVTTF